MAITEKYASAAGGSAHDGSSEANAYSWTEMIADIAAGSKAGLRYNYKGNVSLSASDTLSAGGSVTSPVVIRGYASTPGDGYLGRTNSNGPLITTNLPTVTYGSGFRLNTNAATFVLFESLNFIGNATNSLVGGSAANQVFRGCRFENQSTGSNAAGAAAGATAKFLDCDLSLTGASTTGSNAAALTLTSAGSLALGCRLVGGPGKGIRIDSTASLIGSVVYGCAGIAVAMNSTNATVRIIGNTIVDNLDDAINILTGTAGLTHIVNNLITDNSGYGINGVSAANAVTAAYNRLDRNGGAINLATDWIAATSWGNNTTPALKADEYVDAATHDYRLKSTSPAKAAGLFAYSDIGAIQRMEGGGGLIVHPGMMGI